MSYQVRLDSAEFNDAGSSFIVLVTVSQRGFLAQ
jgi:hypothetical protein